MRVLGLILVLLIGAAAGAGGTWWTLGRKPTVTLVGATKPVTCPDPDPIYPNGMVTTPEKAAAIAELVDYSDNRDPRRPLEVRDRGSQWEVRSGPPRGHRGGGYTIRVAKCDGRAELVEISQ